MKRTLPSSTSSLIAPIVSSIGVNPSGRWYWYRSITSVRRRFSDASIAMRTYSREPRFGGASSVIAWPNFVASTTRSRRPSSALPSRSSLPPRLP